MYTLFIILSVLTFIISIHHRYHSFAAAKQNGYGICSESRSVEHIMTDAENGDNKLKDYKFRSYDDDDANNYEEIRRKKRKREFLQNTVAAVVIFLLLILVYIFFGS